MTKLSVGCRRSVRVLILGAAVMGMLVPASAAEEGNGGVSPQRPLTLSGRPLSRLLNPTITIAGGVDSSIARTTASLASGTLILRVAAAGRVAPVIAPTRSQQGRAPTRSWVGRHPVAFGAIVGAVAGAVIVGATVHAEASFVGFYGGGAAGAVVGWVVSR